MKFGLLYFAGRARAFAVTRHVFIDAPGASRHSIRPGIERRRSLSMSIFHLAPQEGFPHTAYCWDVNGDGVAQGGAVAFSFVYTTEGVFPVTPKVADVPGSTATGSPIGTATVNARNLKRPPNTNARGPYTGIAGSPIKFKVAR